MLIISTKIRNLENSIQETNHTKIKHILYLAKVKGIKAYLIYDGIPLVCKLIQIEDQYIQLFIPDFELSKEHSIEFYFEVANTFFYTKGNIHKKYDEIVSVFFPTFIYKIKDRRYTRIELDSLFIRLTLHYNEDKNNEWFKYSSSLLNAIQIDNATLPLIYNIIISELKQLDPNCSWVDLTKKNSKDYTIFEKTIVTDKKTLVIEDVSKMKSYIENLEDDYICNLYSYFIAKAKELGEREATLLIEAYKKEDSYKNLVSYFMIPVELYEKVIGYFFISTNQFQKKWLTKYTAIEIHQFVQVFSYSLSKITTQNNYFDINGKSMRVINISLSGLLIEVFDRNLYHYLTKHKLIKILIPCGEKEIEMITTVVRFFNLGAAYYLGCVFNEVQKGEDPFIILEQFIYNNLSYNFL